MPGNWTLRKSLGKLDARMLRFERSPTLKLLSMAKSRWERVPLRKREMAFGMLSSLLPLVGGGLYGWRAGRMREVAEVDPLTGAYRRDRINELLSNAVRSASGKKPLSIIKVDLDGFKRFNDIFGHEEADRALQKFVGRVRLHLRSSDKVARNGWQIGKQGETAGDELLVILKNVRNAHAEEIAQRIREFGNMMHHENIGRLATGWGVLNAPPGREIPHIRFGASVGVHTITDPRADLKGALAAAEKRMLEEKQRKKIGR